MLLAETAPPPELNSWLACLFYLAGGALVVLKLVKHFRGEQPQQISPQPFEVKAAAEYVHKPEFSAQMEANQQEHQNLFSKLGGVERGLRAEMKKDTDALHEKINAVSNQNAAQTAKLDLVNQRQVQMDGKIDRLLERASSSFP
jgi:hypothetical protein